jgi:WD40 repeat protein
VRTCNECIQSSGLWIAEEVHLTSIPDEYVCLQDNSVRLWLMDSQSFNVNCVGVGSRHTLSVGSVALSEMSASFFLSVSQDLCLKLWRIPKKLNPGNKVADTL